MIIFFYIVKLSENRKQPNIGPLFSLSSFASKLKI